MSTRSSAAGWWLSAFAALAIAGLLAPAETGAAEEQPPYPHGKFQEDCSICHDAAAWLPAKPKPAFNHAARGFPLLGAHSSAACRSCHATLDFSTTETVCVGCHLDPHESELGTDCERCHTPPASFVDRSHMVLAHRTTRFPLVGSHRVTDCEACHPVVAQGKLRYVNTPVDCESCHLQDYLDTVNPDHEAAAFPRECALCHNTVVWTSAKFDHAATAFPLTGAHVRLDCQLCHASGYTGTPTNCDACHLADYQATTDPNHVSAGFPLDCTLCHTTTAWEGATFNHSTTAFPLTGAHLGLDCQLCHASGYTGTPTNCDACHLTDFQATTDPNHASAGFPLDCTSCHTTTAWLPSSWNHNTTGFPLTGAHVAVNCQLCHASGYPGTPTNCDACHLADYQGTTDPNHVAAGFPLDCTLCHTTTAWEGATFNHSTTAFPLTGAHLGLDCQLCHASGYTGTPTNCDACHLTDFQATTDPNHTSAGFPLDCTSCHTTTAWLPSSWNHNTTGFPLTGAHVAVNCQLCHATSYPGTPTNCDACHLADYQGTTDPNHVAAGLPLDCTFCHTTTAWTPAQTDHSTTGFPLTGAHLSLSCLDCHSGGFTGTPSACSGCHLDDYLATTDPDHEAASFSLSCELCHTTSTWNNARYTEHDPLYFPIYSGKHAGEWNSCADCHTNPSNYAVFSCIDGCHVHSDQADMTGKHESVPGFVYTSDACYFCHPRGVR